MVFYCWNLAVCGWWSAGSYFQAIGSVLNLATQEFYKLNLPVFSSEGRY